jgi:hypothetical protein
MYVSLSHGRSNQAKAEAKLIKNYAMKAYEGVDV